MKKSKQLTIISLTLCLTLLAGMTCHAAEAKSTEKKTVYSNLYDEPTQNKISAQMEKAGISKQNSKAFMGYVKQYNKEMSSIPLAKNGFQTANQLQPEYDDGEALTQWLNSHATTSDINCRITAFGLLKNKITSSGKSRKAGSITIFDLDTINNLPVKEYSKKDITTFKNLYADIKIGTIKSPTDGAEAVKKFWRNNKIKFKTGKDVSMINIYQYFDLDQTLFIGHAGVLIKNGSGYLFVEKYGPTLPYQVTKVSSKADLYYYLMNRLDTGDGEFSAGAFIMENDKLLNPSKIKQQILVERPKNGKFSRQNAQISYSLSKRGDVTVSIYASKGKLAARYKEISISPTQTHTFSWNGKATQENQLKLKIGARLPKGDYYAKLSSEGITTKTKSFRIQ